MFNSNPFRKLSATLMPFIVPLSLRYRSSHYPNVACVYVPVCALLCASVATSAYAESWKVNLQDADIKAFISEVATITNQNFVLDPRINGNVTVISNRALSQEEVYQLFLGVMQVNGIAAIDTGTTIKLVPDNIAKQSGIEIDLQGDSVGEAMRTRVVYLDNAQVGEVLSAIRPLMPQSAHAAAVPGANALVLSDRADSLNQIMALVNILDEGNDSKLGVIPLRYIDADRMMELISGLTETAGSASNVASQFKIIADAQNNRLLVKGSPDTIVEISSMVAQLDTEPTKQLGGLRVFDLKYASASHVASMLKGLLNNESLTSTGATSTLESASLLNNTSGSTNSATANTNSNSNASRSGTTINGSGTTGNGRPYSIIADETQNKLLINASPELMAEIESIIPQLDTRRAQVLIQAAIIEISGNDTKQLGVQWALGNANSGYGVVNFRNVGVSATDLATAALTGAGVSNAASAVAGALLGVGDSRRDSNGNTKFYGAILQALDSTTNANLLSMPSIMTLDNEKASILVGQNVPFVTGSYTTSGNSSTNPFQTIDRQDVGINLNVIPHIGENGTVRLEVSQEVSSVVDASSGSSGLITNKSLINTTILADDQQTIALGGLMRDNTTEGEQKVPVLGNLPVIGRLFRSDSSKSDKSNLIIFLQPTILRDGGAVASVTERRYNQMQVMQLVIDKNGTIKKLPLSNENGVVYNHSAPNNTGINSINHTTQTPIDLTTINSNGNQVNTPKPSSNNIFAIPKSNYELMPLNPLIPTPAQPAPVLTPVNINTPTTPILEPIIMTGVTGVTGVTDAPVSHTANVVEVTNTTNTPNITHTPDVASANTDTIYNKGFYDAAHNEAYNEVHTEELASPPQRVPRLIDYQNAINTADIYKNVPLINRNINR